MPTLTTTVTMTTMTTTTTTTSTLTSYPCSCYQDCRCIIRRITLKCILATLQLLYYRATNDGSYKSAVQNFLSGWFPGGNIPKTPKGLAFRGQWGSLGYAGECTRQPCLFLPERELRYNTNNIFILANENRWIID